jgi:hypothetical protein
LLSTNINGGIDGEIAAFNIILAGLSFCFEQEIKDAPKNRHAKNKRAFLKTEYSLVI